VIFIAQFSFFEKQGQNPNQREDAKTRRKTFAANRHASVFLCVFASLRLILFYGFSF